MKTLIDIEKQFGFEYPEVFHRLEQAQMLDWMRGWNEPWTNERNWYTVVYPTLLNAPPLLLHNKDFELYTLDDVVNRMEDIPDYWDTRHFFVPVGMNSAGDWYALYMSGKNGTDIPIVFVPHDEENATYLAKNMEDFIFRMLLEYVADTDEDEINEPDFKTNIVNMLKSHKSYMVPGQSELLNQIYKREIKEHQYGLNLRKRYTGWGLLSEKELNQLIIENIGFDKLDTEFKFML